MNPDSKITDILPVQQGNNKAPAFKAAEPAQPVSIMCDLVNGSEIEGAFTMPLVPVLAAFGKGPMHLCRLLGKWDLDRAVSENVDSMIRSTCRHYSEEGQRSWSDLIFQFGPTSFLLADDRRIVGFGETAHEAEQLVTDFDKTYKEPPKPTGGSFNLITAGESIDHEEVTLEAKTLLGDEALTLHYGEDGHEWHFDFINQLCASDHGLSIFEGAPGTGKTSYLRHLMAVLKESHRFYFIPSNSLDILSDPKFIRFWAEQRRLHSERKFVVILEDSETALMTRGSDNQEQVSAILNLSDGMLADFLRMQIICTINCAAAEIDQALLRPGRLLTHRIFPKLDYTQATHLAKTLGKKLPSVRAYTLAEVFAERESNTIQRRRIGFAA